MFHLLINIDLMPHVKFHESDQNFARLNYLKFDLGVFPLSCLVITSGLLNSYLFFISNLFGASFKMSYYRRKPTENQWRKQTKCLPRVRSIIFTDYLDLILTIEICLFSFGLSLTQLFIKI